MEQDYRIYRLRDGELQLLATTDTKEGIGTCLVTLWMEGEFERRDNPGVMWRPEGMNVGKWIISPWGWASRPPEDIEL